MTQIRKISKRNTTVRRYPDGKPESVVFHQTEVFKAGLPDADGWREVTLAHGGWITATTQTRINQALAESGLGAFRVSRTGGVMRLWCGGTSLVKGDCGPLREVENVTAGGTIYRIR